MNVLRYELKAARVSAILWICTIVALVALFMSIYPAFANDATAVLNVFKNMPAAMRNITGADADMKLFSFLGFFANIFPFITLIGAIEAAVLGFGILSKESIAKTTDFLLTKPKTRRAIYWQKTGASVIMLLATQVVVVAAAILLSRWSNAGSYDMGQFMMLWGAFVLIQFFMFTLCVLLSQLVKKLRSPVPPALGLSFGLFLLALFALVIGENSVRWLTPFRFIDYKKIITDGTYDMGHIVYALVLIAAFTGVSYIIYTRKDVPAAV